MRQKNNIIIWTLLLIILFLLIWVWNNFLVVINHSDSLPIRGVIIMKGKMPQKREDIFVFWVKNNKFYKQDVKFIKKMAARQNAPIYITQDKHIFVDLQDRGIIKHKSLRGEKLTPLQAKIIPRGKYYAYAEHKDSFDSRYQEIGLIDEKDIIGTAIFNF